MKALKIEGLLLHFRHDDRILLGEKITGEIGQGLLNAPGGKWDRYETILECNAREDWEEARLIVKPSDLFYLGSLECYVDTVLNRRVHVYGTVHFLGSPKDTDSMRNFQWYHRDHLPFDRMHEADRFWLPLAVRRQKFRLQVWYERPGKGYIRHVLTQRSKIEHLF